MKKQLLVAGWVTLLGFAALLAQNNLAVKVQDESGAPLNKVKVQIQGILQNKFDDKNSNRQGMAQFGKLADDYYRVWAHGEGFAPEYHEFLHLTGGANESVTLTLKPGADRNLYFEDPQLLQQANQLLQEGADALRQQKFDVAEERLKGALQINPADPSSMHHLALVYLHMGRFDETEQTLKSLDKLLQMYVQVDPSFAGQLEDIRQLQAAIPLQKLVRSIDQAMEAQKFEEALVLLDELSAKQPENGNLHYTKAVAYVRLNQLENAEAELDKAIALMPGDETFTSLKQQLIQAREARAENEMKSKVAAVLELNKEGKHEEAVARGKEAMEGLTDELKKILWGEMANAYLALEQQEEGMEAYRQMMILGNEPIDEGFFKLGSEYVKRGKQAQARLAFEKVLEVNPDHPEACYQLGMDYFYERGDKENAKRLLEHYLKIGKDQGNLDNARNVLIVIERS